MGRSDHDADPATDHDHDADPATDHDHDADPATDRVHDNSWSVNLELPRHETDRSRVIADAVDAIEHTAPGNHVNLVTHGAHGHPETYLFEALDERVPEVTWEYVERCGCGGHVTRVHVE